MSFSMKSTREIPAINNIRNPRNIENVSSVLAKLRKLSADEDPVEAFKLFAGTSSVGSSIPLAVFASSIQTLCPGVSQPLAHATATVFDRGLSGLVSVKVFREIIFDRSELSRHREEAMHQQVLLLLDEFRDIVATSISDYDGSRGYSAVELRRHYNNMKIKLTHKGISRGRFVTVLKELGLSNDSDTLHAVVDEFDPVGVGYVTFELFSKVVKRDNDNDHFHQRHQEHLTYRLTRHRPQPSKRTEKEARSIVAKFQQHFHTRTSSIEQLHQVFDAFDRYGDGHIASNDFILAMRHLDFSRSTDALQTVVEMLDPEQTGFIAWHTFFDRLALEASSGLTPRCLNIDKYKLGGGVNNNNSDGLLGGNSTMSGSIRRSMLNIATPMDYPDKDRDEDYEQVMQESHLLLQVLEEHVVQAARMFETKRRQKRSKRRQEIKEQFASSSLGEMIKEKKRSRTSNKQEQEERFEEKHGKGDEGKTEGEKKETKEQNEQDEQQATAAIAAQAKIKDEELIEITPAELLHFLVNEFDVLDLTNSGTVNAHKMFKYIEKLKLTDPIPVNVKYIWGAVCVMNKELDGTIAVYDWLRAIGATALDPLSDGMLKFIRQIYQENLTDHTGQDAFRDALVVEEEPNDGGGGSGGGGGGSGKPVLVVSFEKYLSLVATLPRQPFNSIVARYLWDHLCGGVEKRRMTWTTFLVEMLEKDDRAKLNATLRGMSAGKRGLGKSLAEKAAISPRSKQTDSPDNLTHAVEQVWTNLIQLFQPDEHTTRWQKMDAVRRIFFVVSTTGENNGAANEDKEDNNDVSLDHHTFVRLLRNMDVGTNLNALRHVAEEFDLDDSHSIDFIEFCVGIKERPPSKKTGEQRIKRFTGDVRRTGRKIMQVVVKYFNGMGLEEQSEKIEEIFNRRSSTNEGLNKQEFGALLVQFVQETKDVSLLNSGGETFQSDVLSYLCLLFDEDRDGEISIEEFVSCLLTENRFKTHLRREQKRIEKRKQKQMQEQEQKRLREQEAEKEEEQEREIQMNGEVEGGAVDTRRKNKQSKKKRRRGEEVPSFEDDTDDTEDTDEDTEDDGNEDIDFLAARNNAGDMGMAPEPDGLPELPVTDSDESEEGENDEEEGVRYKEHPEERKARKEEEMVKWMMDVSEQNTLLIQSISNLSKTHSENLEQWGKTGNSNGAVKLKDWDGLDRVPNINEMMAKEGSNINDLHAQIVIEGGLLTMGIREKKSRGKRKKKHTGKHKHCKRTIAATVDRHDKVVQRTRKQWEHMLILWERHLEDLELRVQHLAARVQIKTGMGGTSGTSKSITGIDVSHIGGSTGSGSALYNIQAFTMQERHAIYNSIKSMETEVSKHKRQVYRESDYWFTRGASRQSAYSLRFFRDLSKPPQRVHENLLTLTARFRAVDAALKKIKNQFDWKSLGIAENDDRDTNADEPNDADTTLKLQPHPPSSAMKTASPARRYVSKTEVKSFLQRIQKQEIHNTTEREAYLTVALGEQGIATWPPTNVVPPRGITQLRDIYIKHGMDSTVRAAIARNESNKNDDLPVPVHQENQANNRTWTRTRGGANEPNHDNYLKNDKIAQANAVAACIVVGLRSAESACNREIVAKMRLKTRETEINGLLEQVGLAKSKVVKSTTIYNNYLCHRGKEDNNRLFWCNTLAGIVKSIEGKERSRKRTLKNVFKSIDHENKGWINGRAVLKFAMNGGATRTYVPKVCLGLMQGKKYRNTLKNMMINSDLNKDGVVDLEEFTSWALRNWTPKLPNMELARRAVVDHREKKEKLPSGATIE